MALTVDTTAKRIEQGSTAIPTTGSLQVWIFPTWAQTDGLQHTVIGTYNGSGTIDFDIQKFTDNKLYAGWNTVGGTDSRVVVASASYTLNQNAWNHIVLTWTSGGTCTLYLNGSSIGTSATITTYSTAGRIRVIGNDNTHTAGTLGGRVAEYAIWNKALSSAEVTALYNSGSNAQLASQQENASLVDYCPLWGILTTDVNLISSGTSPSLVGSPAQAAHAPVVMFPVQTSTTQSAGSSVNLTFGSTPTVNNAILVKFFVRTTGSINTPTCTDNQGNSYTLSYSKVDSTNKNWVFEFLGKAVTSSGSFIVTAGFTTVSGTNVIDIEINEIHPALFLDKTSTNTGTSTSPTPGSVSITTAPELLSTGFVDDGTGTTSITVPSGYLLTSSDIAGSTKVRDGSALSTAGVTGSFNPTWTTASADWACGQATYSTTANAAAQPPIKAFARQANNRLASPQVGRAA